MPYRLVIFDFDGTLADSRAWMLDVMNRLAERHRFRTTTSEEVEVLRGLSNREIMARLGVSHWRLPFLARDARRLSREAAGWIPLFEGAAGLIGDLAAARIAMAIVSSNSEETVRRVLGADCAARIAYYGCGVSMFGKARRFRALLRQAGLAAVEAICVGDETRDIEAARQAGIAVAAVGWGYATPEVLAAQRPDYQVGDFAELAAVIKR